MAILRREFDLKGPQQAAVWDWMLPLGRHVEAVTRWAHEQSSC